MSPLNKIIARKVMKATTKFRMAAGILSMVRLLLTEPEKSAV